MEVKRHPWLAALGTLPYYLLPVKRDVIEANLKLAYGAGIPQYALKHLTKQVYGNLFTLSFEVVVNALLPRFLKARRIRLEHEDRLDAVLKRGKGVLLLACHIGNWEVGLVNLLAKKASLRQRLNVIRKQLKPPWFHRFVMRLYLKAGMDVVPPDAGCLKKVLKRLKDNEAVIFVLDQHSSADVATSTQLFGHEVYTTKGLARVALQTSTPVLPLFTWKDERGRLACHFGEEIPVADGESRDERIAKTTQAYLDCLEKAIRRYPEQWFGWIHRLWKASGVY
jgi:KDO2-lipid IV(A) lauroyltransferase